MLAFPLVLALFLSWLIGGYVAGRMAGYRRSWHGLMSAIWGLFVALVVALVAGGSAGNFANVSASLPRPDIAQFGNAAVFGFVGGILATMIGGWLGGMVTPAPFGSTAPARQAARPEPVRREAPREREAATERREAVAAAPRREHEVTRERDRESEPSFWDKLTGRDRENVRERDDATREHEPLGGRDRGSELPPHAAGGERDGQPVRDDTEVRR
jgi:hypothetical protein